MSDRDKSGSRDDMVQALASLAANERLDLWTKLAGFMLANNHAADHLKAMVDTAYYQQPKPRRFCRCGRDSMYETGECVKHGVRFK